MRWLEALAKKAQPDDDATVADRMAEAYEASSRGDYARALEIWGPLAHAGVARAQNNVGACFTEGLGVERDPKLAVQWLSLAAAAGDAVGQRNCAALYFKGEGVEQDFARAMELYRAAAEQDDGAAQDMVSWMLLEGEVAAPDYVAARDFAELAASHGVAATPTARPCWARRSISAPESSAIRSRRASGCCAPAPAVARSPDSSFKPCAQ